MKYDLLWKVSAGTAPDGRNGEGAREVQMDHAADEPGNWLSTPGCPAWRDPQRPRRSSRALPRLALFLVIGSLGFAVPPSAVAEFELSQRPLSIGGQGVPGNLALVPSVEWPTINSVANIEPEYDPSATYVGYFDSAKCYAYALDESEEARYEEGERENPANHFYPTGNAGSDSNCANWSGNFLNWAATQTVDPFRKALTGGYRVVDTPTETWLEKARHDGEGGESVYPDRSLAGHSLIAGATPFDAEALRMQIRGQGNRMLFRVDPTLVDGLTPDDSVPYDPAEDVEDGQVYEVNVRVRVCDETVGLEDNCQPYSQGWKPEGTIQRNAHRLRYSAFGYLNDSDMLRDGGVLRAGKKWVGPQYYSPSEGRLVDNDHAEWDADSGVLVQNPNPEEADQLGNIDIEHSGVINAINLFGQLTDAPHKNHDPVSELYYTALRYFRNLGDVPEYSSVTGNPDTRERLSDLLPVVTEWNDPIGNWCEPNVILGIGDVYTHRDKNLPGNDTYTDDEPSKPSEVAADDSVDVIAATNKVGELEGLGDIGSQNEFSGRNNSAYIAGLAYDAHTTDIRPELEGRTTVSTFWIDVLEDQSLAPPARNQYYLATKYGGFTVPADFRPYERTEPLPEAWWHTNDEILVSGGSREPDGTRFPRPDNYFTAGRAADMVDGLENAFSSIVSLTSGSASAIAANSTRLDTGTLIYQARFNTADWSGQLLAIEVDPDDGSIDTTSPLWDAGDRIPANPDVRNIFSIAPDGRSGIEFDTGANGITGAQMDLLDINIDGDGDGLGADRLAYLRGDRDLEVQNGGSFRQRSTLLGDIVNSDPAFVGTDNFGYSIGGTDESDFEYREFRIAKHEFDQGMLYVGSNNGMLHGFDGQTGDEILAYVPNAVYENLSALTSPRYEHQYYVDGSPRHGDAYIDRGSGEEWRTYLVGTTGAGGEAVFALDIPDPNNTSFGTNDVLWEFTHAELGAAMAQPHIARMNDGGWYVIFGNGYNSESGEAGLFLVPLDDPDDYMFIETGVGGTGDDANGLSHTTPVDITGNRTTDYIYGGDMQGNVWRFDVSRANTNQWDADLMFEATDDNGDPQPITAAIEVGPHPSGEGVMTYFGTGQFFEVGDNRVPDDAQTQTFYAVHDTYGATLDRGDLFGQQIVAFDENFRVVGDEPTPENKDGWYLDLPINGERVFNRATLRNERIIFVTNIPTADVCGFGGDSWIMEMNAFLGTGVEEEVFVDADDDFEEGTADGMRFDDMVSRPAIIDTAGDTEFKYLSGSSGDVTQVEESSTTDRLGRRSWREF